MNKRLRIIYFPAVFVICILCSCATTTEYEDENEFSDLPWTQQEDWENSRQMPGMSPGY